MWPPQFERPPRSGFKMNKAAPQSFVSAFNAGHPGAITSINQDGLVESFNRFVGDATLCDYHMVMGKTRDGMGGPFLAPVRNESRATGLLASLMRRI
jgi:hypothetical protein